MFTLSWIGEWERIGGGSFAFTIFVEDISATIGLIFRFAASIIALAAIIFYLSKKKIAKSAVYKILRVILVFEGIYWLGLIATAGFNFQTLASITSHNLPVMDFLALSVIPTTVESIVLPIALFVLAFKLNPNKPLKTPLKWGLITGTIYIVVFWLINTSIWLGIIKSKGIAYLWTEVVQVNGVDQVISHPEHLVSFVTTAFGLLALTIYSGYITKKSTHRETLQDLKLPALGAIILALGTYFLWNYFSWAIFAGNTWNDWYAWFLGHNMDLWMLSLPLVGLPLLFYKPPKLTLCALKEA
jgi:hypothetical protein